MSLLGFAQELTLKCFLVFTFSPIVLGVCQGRRTAHIEAETDGLQIAVETGENSLLETVVVRRKELHVLCVYVCLCITVKEPFPPPGRGLVTSSNPPF